MTRHVDDLGAPTKVLRDALDRLGGRALPLMVGGEGIVNGAGEVVLSLDLKDRLVGDIRFSSCDLGAKARKLLPKSNLSIAAKVSRSGGRIVEMEILHIDYYVARQS